MIRLNTLCLALATVACFSSATVTQAGPGCGCSHGPVHFAPMMNSDPGVNAGCGCAMAASSCCGISNGGGLVQLGSLYGSAGVYGGYHSGGYHGSVNPRGFQSGFESLPNMDGGGVHNRLPFHSYRRPWAHPGIADTSINIVW